MHVLYDGMWCGISAVQCADCRGGLFTCPPLDKPSHSPSLSLSLSLSLSHPHSPLVFFVALAGLLRDSLCASLTKDLRIVIMPSFSPSVEKSRDAHSTDRSRDCCVVSPMSLSCPASLNCSCFRDAHTGRLLAHCCNSRRLPEFYSPQFQSTGLA
jgi:hypothetical protein